MSDLLKKTTESIEQTDSQSPIELTVEYVEENEEQSENNTPLTEQKNKKQKKQRQPLSLRAKITLLSALSIFLLVTVFILSLGLYAYTICSQPVFCEVGETIDLSHVRENKIVSFVSKQTKNIDQLDNKTEGTDTISFKILGVIKANASITFKDTTAPIVITPNLVISQGLQADISLYSKSINDASDITVITDNCTFSNENVGEYSLSLIAEDTYHNSTKFESQVKVIDTQKNLFFMGKNDIDEIKSRLKTQFPNVEQFDFSNAKDHGQYMVTGVDGDTFYVLEIIIDDITAPKATVHSFDVPLGKTVSDEELVSNITDLSEVSISISDRADFNTAGEYFTKITLTDKFNNTADYFSCIRVHNINTNISAELGTSLSELSSLFFNDDFSHNNMKLLDKPTKLGNNTLRLAGSFNTIEVVAEMNDTTPPALVTKDRMMVVGSTPTPNDFIVGCTDALQVTYSIEGYFDTSEEDDFYITIIAEDENGNTTEQNVTLSVVIDDEPPLIYGVENLFYILGEKEPDYFKGIYSFDDVWEYLPVTVDTSKVDYKTEGEYEIAYKSLDKSRNEAIEKAILTVKQPTCVQLDVENILQLPDLPNGCEAASLAIALTYAGYSVTPLDIYYNYMPQTPYRAGNPWTSYVGDATGLGYGCYAPCVVSTGNDFLSQFETDLQVVDVSGKALEEYKQYIDKGIPVIMWGLIDMNCNDRLAWSAYIKGKYVDWHSYSHCLVLIGYTDYGYIFCDPLVGVEEYDTILVDESFKINYRQACVIQEVPIENE